MTLTSRILAYVEICPGRTSWSISRALSEDPHYVAGSVSSLLRQLAKKSRLRRAARPDGAWGYWPVNS